MVKTKYNVEDVVEYKKKNMSRKNTGLILKVTEAEEDVIYKVRIIDRFCSMFLPEITYVHECDVKRKLNLSIFWEKIREKVEQLLTEQEKAEINKRSNNDER